MNLQELIERFGDFGAVGMEQTGIPVFLLALGFSLASALFVSYLYRVFCASRVTGSQVHHGFPLIAVSVTAIFITIQFSLPLSLGLLGALSIVRFRTPIKEPEEIAFILLVVAASLCCATFNFLFLGVILTAAVIALLTMRRFRGRGAVFGHGMVVVTVPATEGGAEDGALIDLLRRELPSGTLEGVTGAPEHLVISYRFVALEPERVSSVRGAVRGAVPGASCDVYFDRAGAP